MFGLGTSEMVIFGVIALLLYGKRLPEVAKGLGQSFRQFKDGLSGIDEDFTNPMKSVQKSINNAMNSPVNYSSSGSNNRLGSNTTSTTAKTADFEEEAPSAPRFELPSKNE
jgi:sec-independent protein translocase protein TatA